MKPVRAVQVTMHYHPLTSGGQQIYVEELRTLLESKGLVTTIIQPDRNSDPPEYVLVTRPPRGLRRISRHVSWFWFTAMLRRHGELLRKADIVISHYPFHYPGIPARANTIVLSHGVDWPEHPVKPVDRYKAWVSVRCMRDRVPVVANDTDYFRRTGLRVPLGHEPFTMVDDVSWYIPNAVDPDRFFDEGQKRERIVLVPRNIRKSRGIHLAIKAFAMFVTSHSNYRLHIAGGQLRGSYYEECVALVKEYQLTNSVRFLGEVDYRQMRELYQKAELTLIPTIAFEGTSYSALEAMACGSAVLSTPVGGLNDLPTVKAEANSEAIAEGLERLLSDRVQIAGRQKDIVNEIFNIVRWREAWVKVIDWRMSLPE